MDSDREPATPAAHNMNPLDEFSECHSGILANLEKLRDLPAQVAVAQGVIETSASLVEFFDAAVMTHHAEEERDLFPAVLSSARVGEERASVQSLVRDLTAEHRRIENAWATIKPALKSISKGHMTPLDAPAVKALVETYQRHAQFEEREFLPLSQEILGREDSHMAALGLSLHMKHVIPEVMKKYGSRF